MIRVDYTYWYERGNRGLFKHGREEFATVEDAEEFVTCADIDFHKVKMDGKEVINKFG